VSGLHSLQDRALDVLDDELRCVRSTERFVLAPLVQDDVDDVLAHFGEPRVTEFLDIRPLENRSDARELIDWALALRSGGQGLRWAVRDARGGFVGTCGLHMMNLVRGRRAEIGYDLAPAWWGRGAMSELMRAALAFGFGELGLRRIEAMVTPGNVRSCAVLERHGFVREGLLRDYGFWRDRFWDQILYARLADDPPGR
jgi:ribosomal-protein-alanine N-acetyltransferase